MRILLVDNYDSFTWNIEHILVSAGARVDVVRNDAINPHAVVQFDGLVLSPGPGVPDEAGQLMRIIPVAAAHSVPTLGVCLGMQAIATLRVQSKGPKPKKPNWRRRHRYFLYGAPREPR